MAVLETEKIDKALTKKGFELKKKRDHHVYFYYYNGKKTAINTKTSHGKREISDTLISMMAKQLHLGKKDFINLIECTLSKEAYLEILLESNILS